MEKNHIPQRFYIKIYQPTMPELPEVQTFKRYFDGTSLGQKINEVVVHDDKIIQDMDGHSFAEKLAGRIFLKSYRQGK